MIKNDKIALRISLICGKNTKFLFQNWQNQRLDATVSFS